MTMYEWTRLVTLEKQIKIYMFNTQFKSIKIGKTDNVAR